MYQRRDAISGAELRKLRTSFQPLTARQASWICGVDVSTYRRWERSRSRVPYAAYVTLHVHLTGLASWVTGWCCWSFKGEKLCGPAGESFSADDLRRRHVDTDRAKVLSFRKIKEDR